MMITDIDRSISSPLRSYAKCPLRQSKQIHYFFLKRQSFSHKRFRRQKSINSNLGEKFSTFLGGPLERASRVSWENYAGANSSSKASQRTVRPRNEVTRSRSWQAVSKSLISERCMSNLARRRVSSKNKIRRMCKRENKSL